MTTENRGIFDDDGVSTAFKDTYLNMMAAFFILALVFLAGVNVPGSEKVKESDPPGNVMIEIYWPEELNTDVDLWVKGPEGPPIGYSNKGGVHYNYLRDDLGRTVKEDLINYELSASRGLPKGPHCANVHLYSNTSGILPVHVTATVKISKGEGEDIKGGGIPVLITEVDLPSVGKEKNLFCFALDEKGDIITDGDLKPFSSDEIRLRSFTGQ